MIFASISNTCLYSELLSESIASVIHPIIGILLYINENVLVLKQQGVLKKNQRKHYDILPGVNKKQGCWMK